MQSVCRGTRDCGTEGMLWEKAFKVQTSSLKQPQRFLVEHRTFVIRLSV
jgi:hypothetical protein